jgi:hypothetical protein
MARKVAADVLCDQASIDVGAAAGRGAGVKRQPLAPIELVRLLRDGLPEQQYGCRSHEGEGDPVPKHLLPYWL